MARTASGTGGVSQRKDGTWEARFSYVDSRTGTRKRMSSYGRTQAEALKKRDEARDRVRADLPARDARETLASYARRWVETSLKAASVKESTRELYGWVAEHRIARHEVGRKPLAAIRRTEVAEYMNALEKAGLSAATRRQAFAVLRAILGAAVEDGLIGKNPAEARGLRPSARRAEKHNDERIRALKPAELAALLKATDGMRYGRLVRLLAFTGLRRGEALALRWRDVDLDERAVYVRGTLSRVGGELKRTVPKTARSTRRVDIPIGIVEALKAEKVAQAKRRKDAGDLWGMTRQKDGGHVRSNLADEGLVFTTDTGTPVEPHNVLRAVQTAATRAKLEGVTVHTLRHTAASLLIEAGEPLKKVSEHLGHSSIAITSDVYGHLQPDARRSTADRLAALIGED